MDYLLDNMLQQGVLTGSRAFNCATPTDKELRIEAFVKIMDKVGITNA